MLGTMLGKHSLGGLIAGILFWMVILFAGALLKELNAILLPYASVWSFVSGESVFGAAEHQWILLNRSFYAGLGLLFMAGSIFIINRKTA